MSEDETRIRIESQLDTVVARQAARRLASALGFSTSQATLIATAVSEISRNIIQYAKRGEIRLSVDRDPRRLGLVVVAVDEGPGIPDVERALQDGFSTGNSLGLGLPGAKRIMDELVVTSAVGVGTTVTMKKWMS